MIPLIDVSLVLLIFFIMTGTSVVVASTIKTPEAKFGDLYVKPDIFWIGLEKDPEGKPVYTLGRGEKPPATPEDRDIKTLNGLLGRLDQHLVREPGPVEVNIRANENLASGYVLDLIVELGHRGKMIKKVYTGVSAKEEK
jgi:biopolymer transport protein ExbD